MDNFIEEVDEELKRERNLELWNKYGRLAVSAILVVVIAVAGYVGWGQYKVNSRSESGLRYVAALNLASAGKSKEALVALQALGKEGTAGYRELARFQAAAVLAGEGNQAGAAGIYDAISRDGSADSVFRDLALILYALNVTDRADPKVLALRLEPLSKADNPWRYSAMEITALLAQRRGDVAAARVLYKKLADETTVPPRLRARAAEFLAVLGK